MVFLNSSINNNELKCWLKIKVKLIYKSKNKSKHLLKQKDYFLNGFKLHPI